MNSGQSPPTSPAEPSSAPEVEAVDPVQLAESLKEKGNTAFRAKRYQEAIEEYSKAIGIHFSIILFQ